MSQKETKGDDQKVNAEKGPQAGGPKKTSLLEMQDLLQNKKKDQHLNEEKEKAHNNSEDAETTEAELVEKQLSQLPALEI